MVRPVSIVWFERCYLGSIVAGLATNALSWNATMAKMSENPQFAQFGPSFASNMLIGGMLFGLLISLLLWYFTARKGSVVTKWIITVFFVLGLLGLITNAARGSIPHGLTGVLVVVTWVLSALAVWQLFKPDTKSWFGETRA